MGCVVFHYDMVGYADSVQLEHRPGIRDKMNTPENWGYFSPQAEARLQSMMGLQTYNSIRALDFLSELPDVDPQRIAVTGASGGGTQTFILCAIDPRPAVAFPAVMVSTAMQGGCTCENACYLRIGTGNVELAALIAPAAAGHDGRRRLDQGDRHQGPARAESSIYRMLGVEDLVMATPLLQFRPQLQLRQSRAAMYDWLNKHLKLGPAEPIVEGDFKPLTVAEMSVWDDAHPKPAGGDDYERSLLRWITEDSQRQMAALTPTDAESLAEYRRVVGGAVDVMIGRDVLPAEACTRIDATSARRKRRATGRCRLLMLLLRNARASKCRPCCSCPRPTWNQRRGRPSGSTARASRGCSTRGASRRCRRAVGRPAWRSRGRSVRPGRVHGRRQADRQGPAKSSGNEPGPSTPDTRSATTTRCSPSESTTSSPLISLVKNTGEHPARRSIWSDSPARAIGSPRPRAQAGEAVDRAAIDTAGFRFASVAAIDDPDFLPGGAKYLDLPGIVALAAPRPLWLAGEGAEPPPVVTAAYRSAAAADRVTVFGGEGDREDKAVEWLLQ